MGSWFSNLHVRKNDGISQDSVMEYIRKRMLAQQYEPVSSEGEADVSFAVATDADSQWYSVYSDLFSFGKPASFTEFAAPMSSALGSDVLGISCFDSDYLCLNLIHADSGVDAWASVGSANGLGIARRNNLSAWKGKVADFPAFSDAIKQKYVFAEEVLDALAPCLHLPQELSFAFLEELDKGAEYLYFKFPNALKTQELPKLVQRTISRMPCFVDKPGSVTALNVGGVSKGLSVFFLGPYVEQETLTFSEVCFVKSDGNHIPVTLEKRHLTNGQWAYYYHDPAFRIPPKVDERLPWSKRSQQEFEREIMLRFVPRGDARKVLDVTVVLMPDKNPQGSVVWNVWQAYGSKKSYIEEYNSTWSMFPNFPNAKDMLLREEDFD